MDNILDDWKDHVKLYPEERQKKGGQHAGISPVGVWATHEPTGLKAFCGFQRTQHQNRSIAFDMLEQGLIELEKRNNNEN